jgi:hypothetical protein
VIQLLLRWKIHSGIEYSARCNVCGAPGRPFGCNLSNPRFAFHQVGEQRSCIVAERRDDAEAGDDHASHDGWLLLRIRIGETDDIANALNFERKLTGKE